MLRRICLLRRLMRFDYRYSHSARYVTPKATAAPTSTRRLDYSPCSFNSFGFKYKWTAEHPRCVHYYSEEPKGEGESGWERKDIIKRGDVVNLSQLLFTKDRDFLHRCHDHQLVTAEQLAHKLIVLYFVPLYYVGDPYPPDRLHTGSVMDIYDDLKMKNCFEVVVVVVDDIPSFNGDYGPPDLYLHLQKAFQAMTSKYPSWTAIPFTDITCRKRLQSKFGHIGKISGPEMVLIDPEGRVLDTNPQYLFQTYGSEAYPFTDDRIAFLNSKDKTAFSQHSLKKLLGSSERDFVISNKGEKVPIHALEDKVVALYFFEDGFSPDIITNTLKMYYEKLKTNQNFEVVLLYLHDTVRTTHTTVKTFERTLQTIPWLALPYKDPVHKKLKRIFGYPDERYDFIEEPTLVIVGPRRDFIGSRFITEPIAATISSGLDEKLFRRQEFAKVGGEKSFGKLKLEMLFIPNAVFKRKDAPQVQLSQLVGKRIIILFEGNYPEYDGAQFLRSLTAAYVRMKGTADEFEVIYFPNIKDENGERVADMPWLVSSAVDLLPDCSAFLALYGNGLDRNHSSLLLAFDRNGSLVRRTICPCLGDDHFPFHADGFEAFDMEGSDFCWGYWDILYQGLLRDSRKQISFPSGDHLFCVYYY